VLSPVENPHRRTGGAHQSAPMMRLRKFEVNNWSDQLTPDFGSPILGWSDQIAV